MNKFEFNMASHSSSQKIPFGAAKLCQDVATLLNNRQSSDIQFKVGGDSDNSATVTLYAHSLILRCRSSYFAAMLDEERNWKESSNGVIYKPNISPTTFQDVLYYLYTGNVRTSENIMELIAAADEMGLEELSAECQNELIRTVKSIFSDEDERSTNQHIPIDVAIRTHIIPSLNFANSHSLSDLSKELFTIILSCMSVIIKSPDAYTTFINGISSEVLIKIISSDDLAITEHSVWDLIVDWACCQTKLLKTAIDAHLNNLDEEEEEEEEMDLSDNETISPAQLNQFKKTLAPLLPSIRFSLLDSNEYRSMVNTLNYILPRRRFVEITEYFLNPDVAGLLDEPRKIYSRNIVESKIIVEPAAWELLRKNIFETGGIVGCHSLNDLKFKLLFRASEHGFLAATFHQHCDNKGPTLVIIRSSDGHIFGGVNFNSWESTPSESYSLSALNFLFALPDGCHRKNSDIFKIKATHTKYSSLNRSSYGPAFGGCSDVCDLFISNSANANNNSHSYLPSCYDGRGASTTALAGSQYFIVSDYEVFAISK